MKLEVEVPIKASAENIWKVITDIENAAETISGINEVEILERPESGLIGLKWKETRTMFGKQATEVMWITNVSEYEFYKTKAESHGCLYLSTLRIFKTDDGCILQMGFQSKPQKLMAKIMAPIMGLFFKGMLRKVILQDLEDIKKKVEGGT